MFARETSDAIIDVQIEKTQFYAKGWISWQFQLHIELNLKIVKVFLTVSGISQIVEPCQPIRDGQLGRYFENPPQLDFDRLLLLSKLQ